MKLNSYLNFAGKAEEAFRYYEQHLGAKTLFIMRFNQMPGPDAAKHAPPGFENKVLHGTLAIADTTIMAADVPKAEPMRSAYLTLSVDSNEEAERIYKALADGGEVFLSRRFERDPHLVFRRFGDKADRAGLGLQQRGEAGIVGGRAARAARHAEGGELRVLELRRIGEEAVVGRIGAGPAALDVIDAQQVELARDRHLVGHGEVDALRLRAVAQGRVEEVDAVGRAHGGAHHRGEERER